MMVVTVSRPPGSGHAWPGQRQRSSNARTIGTIGDRLPEGLYLATSDEVQGLIAQGRTIQETIEIAQDVAKRLIEAQEARHVERLLPQVADSFDYPMIVNA